MSEFRIVTSATELDYSKLRIPGSEVGVVPVVCQDVSLDGLLAYRMQGFANLDAVAVTLATRRATFWSRKRNGLWTKGEESGNFLLVNQAYTDCDADSLLLDVSAQGPTCHLGAETCFTLPEGKEN